MITANNMIAAQKPPMITRKNAVVLSVSRAEAPKNQAVRLSDVSPDAVSRLRTAYRSYRYSDRGTALNKKRRRTMSKNNIVVPEAKDALERFKMEAASEVGVNLKQGYNGDLTSKQAGSIGGQMVKKMIESYENGLK